MVKFLVLVDAVPAELTFAAPTQHTTAEIADHKPNKVGEVVCYKLLFAFHLILQVFFKVPFS